MHAVVPTKALRCVNERIAVDAGALRIVLVADTHSRPHPRALELVVSEKPDLIVHAGDIGDLAVLQDLRRIARLSAVRGNIDGHGPDIPDARTIDVCDGDERLFRILLVHIALRGPKLHGDVVKLARKEDATMVICGHSHVPFIGRDRDLLVLNPGSIGPRRFQLPIVFGVIAIEGGRITELKHVDCETGLRWLP